MSLKLDRRLFLKALGVHLALPLVSTVVPSTARADDNVPGQRRRFIGVFFPNGAHMPLGADGNWNFDEALAPLTAAGHREHAVVVRNLFNGFPDIDPHWQNAAGFLSCRRIVLGDAAVARAGKTLDQVVAETYAAPLRSLEVGAPYYHVHPLNDHPGYSNDYLNRISWQTDDRFRSPISDPRQMFEKLFAVDDSGAARIRHLHARNKSILDHLHKDATRLSTKLPGEYRPVLDSYLQTVREVEQQLDANSTTSTCTPSLSAPGGDFTDLQSRYRERFLLMNQMVVQALQCGLVNASTFMYGPSSSDLTCAEVLGDGVGHHGCAHNRGEAPLIQRLRGMNVVHMELLADLLTRVQSAGLLDSTLVLAGSDMSDGDLHATENLPVVLCGGGADLRYGEAVSGGRRPLSDLHVDIMRLMDIAVPDVWGDGDLTSTQQPLPIRL
ncbi:MAG TPA: DUF1552 domain-containing protein [Myxococcota bacterium]